jgi:general secretion pathway protein D
MFFWSAPNVTLRPRIATITLLFAVLAGCDTLPGNKPDAIATELATPKAPLSPPVRTQPATPEDKPINMRKAGDSKSQTAADLSPGTGRLLNYEQAAKPAPGSGGTPASGDESTLNFENQPIQAVVQAILGAWLGENYTVSPAVTGNVTFSTSKPISSSQALPVLEMLLSWTNNALIRKQGRYEVVPVKDAVAGNLTVGISGARMAPGYQLRVFPLKYISPSEMQKLLKPYAKADSIVSADNARSMIVLAGTQFELQNYERTIDVFDVDWLKGMSVGVFGLRNVEVAKIMPELDKIFGDKAETPVAGMFRFIPMEATNSIIVITPQSDYLKRVQEWLYRLDVGAGENGTQLYVYDVKNVKAVDLSDHLNAIYTGKGGTTKSSSGGTAPGLKGTTIGGTGGGGLGGGGSGALGINQAMSKPATPTPALTTTGTGGPAGAAGAKETDIRITPIEENNQLLVMATPGEYDSILAAIHRLDVVPLQVQIEAKVLEVTLTGDLSYGVQWWFQGLINQSTGDTGYQYGPQFQGNSADRHRASLGGGTTAKPTTGGGLFYSFLNKNFEVALSALQTDGVSKTLSAPSMVVLNNQEAQITVGTQIPIVTTSIVGLGTTTTGTNSSLGTNTGIGSTSYISTGTTLDIKPRVNPGGLVFMEVSQEVTAPGAAATGDNPPISQRNLSTQVAVQSGQTVLLGGLISESDTDSNTGVPLLSSVPVLGKLFSNTSKNRTRTEIIVLITPTVITSSEDARVVTEEYQKQFQSLAPLRAKQAQEGKPYPPTSAPALSPAVTTPLPKSNQ